MTFLARSEHVVDRPVVPVQTLHPVTTLGRVPPHKYEWHPASPNEGSCPRLHQPSASGNDDLCVPLLSPHLGLLKNAGCLCQHLVVDGDFPRHYGIHVSVRSPHTHVEPTTKRENVHLIRVRSEDSMYSSVSQASKIRFQEGV